MRKIEFSKKAEKVLEKLYVSNKKQAAAIAEEVHKLPTNTMPSDVKKLKGHELYRIRVGDFASSTISMKQQFSLQSLIEGM